MEKIYIGIDNGVSGTIGVVGGNAKAFFCKTPVKRVQDYCKVKKMITRIDHDKLYELLANYAGFMEVHVLMERPMVNPSLWRASESAMRAFEVTWAIVEHLNLPHSFCASTDWQKDLLPKHKGKYNPTELKEMSLNIGNRIYPQFKDVKHSDRDGLLIAHWAKLQGL